MLCLESSARKTDRHGRQGSAGVAQRLRWCALFGLERKQERASLARARLRLHVGLEGRQRRPEVVKRGLLACGALSDPPTPVGIRALLPSHRGRMRRRDERFVWMRQIPCKLELAEVAEKLVVE
jgi:hypothetical protein